MARAGTTNKSLWHRALADGRAKAARYYAKRPHRSFRPTHPTNTRPAIAKVVPLVLGSFRLFFTEYKLLISFMLLFAAVTYFLIGGVSQLNFAELRQATHDFFGGNMGAFGSVVALFGTVVTGGLSSQPTQVQQFIMAMSVLVGWLAVVWLVRQRLANKKTSLREALYNCCGPLIPSIMVLAIMFLQLIPGAFGLLLATITLTGTWLQGGVESMLVTVAAFLLCVLSLYWMTASLIGLGIVALPGMSPWRALAAAGELAIGRRWRLVLRVIILVAVIFIVWAAILIPTLLLDSWLRFDWLPLIPIIVQLLSAFTVTYASIYIYKMYRSLL